MTPTTETGPIFTLEDVLRLQRLAASFEFRDGKIVKHADCFDLYRWSRQALGPAGLLLGWTPLLQNKVRAMAAKGLADYQRNSKPSDPTSRT